MGRMTNMHMHSPNSDREVARLELFRFSLIGGEMRFMYASGADSEIYHLVVRDEFETLCGLRVSRLRSQHALHIVEDVSSSVICKHCARIGKEAEPRQQR
jgi:hypothetical protein